MADTGKVAFLGIKNKWSCIIGHPVHPGECPESIVFADAFTHSFAVKPISFNRGHLIYVKYDAIWEQLDPNNFSKVLIVFHSCFSRKKFLFGL